MNRKYGVEKDWISTSGLRCVVLRGGYKNHRCGYVAVPYGHPLYGVDYMAGCEALGPSEYTWRDSQFASPEEKLDVHGGVTYSDGGDGYPVDLADVWWFGFDCMHAWDECDGGRPLPYVIDECESLARQLVAIAEERHDQP